MRVLIVDESPERADLLREGLERAGHEVVAVLDSPIELLRAVEAIKPDAIIIDTESPSRDVLEHVVLITRDQPRPIVMFANDDAPDAIRNAVAGRRIGLRRRRSRPPSREIDRRGGGGQVRRASAAARRAALQASFKSGTNCGSCLPELRRRVSLAIALPRDRILTV